MALGSQRNGLQLEGLDLAWLLGHRDRASHHEGPGRRPNRKTTEAPRVMLGWRSEPAPRATRDPWLFIAPSPVISERRRGGLVGEMKGVRATGSGFGSACILQHPLKGTDVLRARLSLIHI